MNIAPRILLQTVLVFTKCPWLISISGEVSTNCFNSFSLSYIIWILAMLFHTVLIPTLQMNLVDWFKVMVASRRWEELIDNLIEVHPPPKALKRALILCLHCIDFHPLSSLRWSKLYTCSRQKTFLSIV